MKKTGRKYTPKPYKEHPKVIKPTPEEESKLPAAPDRALEVANLLMTGKASTAREVADQTGMDLQAVLTLMCNDKFSNQLISLKRNLYASEFFIEGYTTLLEDFRSDSLKVSERVALSQEIRELLALKQEKRGGGVSVTFNMGEMIKNVRGEDLKDALEIKFPGYDDEDS